MVSTGWNANDVLCGSSHGSTARPGWDGGRQRGTRRRCCAWRTVSTPRSKPLFHDQQPDGCPSDLLEKQSYLRAHAMFALLDGNAARLGRPEIVVVVDHSQPTPDGRATVDWGLPVELPQRVLADLARTARTYTVVVRNGVIIDAPGELNLGRTTRLANRAQRRALGAIYATCAFPGCCVRYSRTKLHHVIWWRHGGLSDIDNFLPVCEQHHQKIHKDGWLLRLSPNCTLTITLPDGTIMTTGPPKRNAA
jgi:hypothetical protein